MRGICGAWKGLVNGICTDDTRTKCVWLLGLRETSCLPRSVQRGVWTAALIGMWAGGYFGAQQLPPIGFLFDPSTVIDPCLPCVPWLIWVYMLGFMLPLIPAAIMPAELFMRAVGAYALVIASASLVFVLLPTDGRPLRAQCDGTSDWALATLQRLDTSANLFPSLHVAFAVLAALCVRRAGSRGGPLLFATAVAQAITVCLVKQHYVMDAVAGALFGLAAYAVAFSISDRCRPASGAGIQSCSSK